MSFLSRRPSASVVATSDPRVPFVGLETPRKWLAVFFLAASLWYLHWRLGTYNPDAPVLWWLVYVAECFGFQTAVMHVFMCWRLTRRVSPPVPAALSVDVFIPTYNESVALVRRTLLAAKAMDYAHQTWLLDDGRRPEMAKLAAQLGCRYLSRADNRHAKAGNLNNALQHSAAEFVAIFDADHAPRRDFLLKTLGYFNDARVGFVQTPQDFYNLDSYQHRSKRGRTTLWTEQSLFFRVIQRGKDFWNSAFFCGSCAVVRRRTLDDIGGFATGTITEDLHTSVRIHAKGWKSVYHSEALAFGLAPESIEPFLSQRIRWGQGAMHVWRTEGLLLHKGLTLAQRINYFASAVTYFDGWQRAVFYLTPVFVLTTGTLPLLSTLPDFIAHFIPYYVLTFWTFSEVGRGYGRVFQVEQYNMARFAAFAWATLALIAPTRKFRVTAKGAFIARWRRFTLPQWSVLSLNVLAVPVGLWLYAGDRMPMESLFANAIWAGVNAMLALCVLSFTSVTQRNKRSGYRFPVPLTAKLTTREGVEWPGCLDDVSASGFRFHGALPGHLAVGDTVEGHLVLPDGPLVFAAKMRSAPSSGAAQPAPPAAGFSFVLSEAATHRLESFLFGSDLQWKINGLSDQAPTPMSLMLPRLVQGPRREALAGMRWNGAEILQQQSLMPVLVSAGQPAGDDPFLLSYSPLPPGLPLQVRLFDRPAARYGWVVLVSLPDDSLNASSAFLYRIRSAESMLVDLGSTSAASPEPVRPLVRT